MGNPNSLVGSFVLPILRSLFLDLQHTMGRKTQDTVRDTTMVERRMSDEGLAFATTTLPMLGQALDASLASGKSPIFRGFALWNGVPLFMRDVWEQVFDGGETLRSDAPPSAVRALRQVAYLFYKLELPFSSEVRFKKFQQYVELDESLPPVDGSLDLLSTNARSAVDAAGVLIRRLFDVGVAGRPFDPSDIVPQHGPGAVADGCMPHEKYVWRTFYDDVDVEYAYCDYMYYNYHHFLCRYDEFRALPRMKAGFANLAVVPKDSRGPRLISVEPLEYQFLQQGLGRAIMRWTEANRLTRGYVNFTSQNINRDLALYASTFEHPVLDTLDMKDASDRVSCQLVKQLFSPAMWRKLRALRTIGNKIPQQDGGVAHLVTKKFAPMGSALCFPVESLVFWSLAQAVLDPAFCYSRKRKLSDSEVWVFGDDLITPSGALGQLEPVFEELHLRFNRGKCCTGSYFRESCGMDAFKGEDVTPVRIKQHSTLVSGTFLSWVAYANAFSTMGFHNVSELLFGMVERSKGLLPYAAAGTSMFARNVVSAEVADDLNSNRLKRRWNSALCRNEYLVVTPSPKRYNPPGLTLWEELFRATHKACRADWMATQPYSQHARPDCAPTKSNNWFEIADAEDSQVGAYPIHRVVTFTKKWIGLHQPIAAESSQFSL